MGLGNWLFGPSEADQQESANLDKALAEQNLRYQPGGDLYETKAATDGAFAAEANLKTVQEHQAAQALDTATGGQQVDAAFNSGLQDGYNNVTGGINATLKAPFQFAWKSIPWQIWLVGAGVAFFYLGGFTYLKGIFARK